MKRLLLALVLAFALVLMLTIANAEVDSVAFPAIAYAGTIYQGQSGDVFLDEVTGISQIYITDTLAIKIDADQMFLFPRPEKKIARAQIHLATIVMVRGPAFEATSQFMTADDAIATYTHLDATGLRASPHYIEAVQGIFDDAKTLHDLLEEITTIGAGHALV